MEPINEKNMLLRKVVPFLLVLGLPVFSGDGNEVAFSPQPSAPQPELHPTALAAEVKAEHDIPPAWKENVLSQISESEYQFTWQPGEAAWHCPNRAQNLRAYVSAASLRLMPRQQGDKPWQLQMRTLSLGREGFTPFLTDEKAAFQSSGGSRLLISQPQFDIEYLNDENGLRQNFIVNEKPPGEGPLQVTLACEGLSPVADGGRAVKMVQTDSLTGEVRVCMHYRDLRAWDARGRSLDAEMRVHHTHLILAVNDDSAAYPLTIDPLSTTLHWQGESNQSGGYLGGAVTTAGDINGDGYSDVVAGAYGYDNGQLDEGMLFVYHGSATGLSSTPTYTRELNVASSYYGYSLATAGDVNGDGFSDLIVGAYIYSNGQSSEGAAFILHGSAAGLSVSPVWSAESNQAFAWFGLGVSSAGDVNGDGYSDILVAAEGYDNGQVNEGRAYLYYGSATGVNALPAWTYETNVASSSLGRVAPAGDVNGDGYSDVILGASQHTNGQTNEGLALVFHGSAAGLPLAPNFSGECNLAGANLGYSVSSAGDVNGDGYSDVVAGAQYYTNGQTSEGRIYLWYGSAAGINPAAVTREVNQADAYLGYAVACAGDVNGDGFSDVIASANYYDNGQADEGQVYVWGGSAAGLSTLPVWTMEINQASAYFGASVSSAGDVNGDGYSDVLIGTWAYDNPELSEGGAFVYLGSGSMASTTAAWTGESNQLNAQFGVYLNGAGDVNGDGYADIAVAAVNFDNGQTDEGRVFVYHGSATGPALAPNWTAESNQASAGFGYGVACAGDVNGDGYSDLIIGSYQYDNGQTDEGAAFIYHGSATGLALTPNWTGEANLGTAYYGISVAGAGDVNGDGYSDIVVGSAFWGNGQATEGAAFVHYGSAAGISNPASWSFENNQAASTLGRCVSSAGDVNGDGYADLLIGCPYYDNGQTDEGMAYVFHGSASGLPASPNWTYESDQANAALSWSCASAGDVNADGFSDLIIGAHYFDNGQSDEGVAYVFHGSSSGLPAIATSMTEGNLAGVQHGWSVSSAGDVNGDGYSDVIIGAKFYNNGTVDEGIARIYTGGPTGITLTPAWLTESNQGLALYGWCVAGAGDVNGDGFGDVLVGSHLFDNGTADEGMAWLYPGNGALGKARPTRQYRSDLTTPVMQGNSAFSAGCAFGIGQFAKTHTMRMPVKLQWELFVNGVPYSGSPITNSVSYQGQSATWTNTTATGIEIKQALTGSSVLTKWRVRMKYHPTLMIDGAPSSRWFYFDPNGGDFAFNVFAGASCGPLAAEEITLVASQLPGSSQVQLHWQHENAGAAQWFYEVEKKTGTEWISLGFASPADLTWTDEPVGPHQVVEYRITGRNALGAESHSNIAVINPLSSDEISLWPNPGTDWLHIESGRVLSLVQMYNAEGRLLRAWTHETEFSTSGLPAGTYWLRITFEDFSSVSRQWLIRR